MGRTVEDRWSLRERFLTLLDQQEKEQVYQDFIERNTVFVPREFVQNHGVHMDVVFRKLPLGGDYTTDFCYLSKSSDDWHIVLIEIEKPQSRYFKNASTKFHPDFLSALEQITQWRAWFSNTAHCNAFVNGTLGQVRDPFRHNPCSIKYVLVHGRRAEFAEDENRRRMISECERDDFQILSFDSLAEGLSAKGELYLAIKKNDHIEVLSQTFISEELFVFLPASYVRITDGLRKSTLDNKRLWHYVSSFSPHRFVLEEKLSQFGVIVAPGAL